MLEIEKGSGDEIENEMMKLMNNIPIKVYMI